MDANTPARQAIPNPHPVVRRVPPRNRVWSCPQRRGRHSWRAAGLTLLVTGLLFATLWLREIVPGAVHGVPPRSLVDAGLVANPIHVIDLAMVLPAFIGTGIGTLRGAGRSMFWCAPRPAFSALMGASIVFGMALSAASGTAGPSPA